MGSLFSKSQCQIASEHKCTTREKLLASAQDWEVDRFGEYIRVPAAEIVRRVESREWTAVDVLEAYISRTVWAHRRTNAVTEVMFDHARERARSLDQEFARTGNLKGPLHGVPVSFKDTYNFVGFDSCVGYSSWVGQPATRQNDIATQLIAAGAVPFVKTNVPQTLFNFACSNPIFGATTHPSTSPHAPSYSAGGSSGGEAALLSLSASPLGVGSDVGGSLRIPAGYCGVYSLKPGCGRVSYKGVREVRGGWEGVRCVNGAMGRSVDDLILASKVMFGAAGRDHDVAPLAFREDMLRENSASDPAAGREKRKLRFGYYTNDGYLKTSPACQRAVLEAVDALRKSGVECVQIDIPKGLVTRATEVFLALSSADGYEGLRRPLGRDPLDPDNFLTVRLTSLVPYFLRYIVCNLIRTVLGDETAASTVLATRKKGIVEYQQAVAARGEVREWWNRDVWDAYGVDGIVAPVQAIPQLPNGACKEVLFLAGSTSLYNTLDIPVGVLPVCRVEPSLDALPARSSSINPVGAEGGANATNWRDEEGGSKLFEAMLYGRDGGGFGKGYYDVEKMEGMPIGVQVVGRRWEEEKVLGLMKVLDEALGERGFGPSDGR